MKKTEQIEANAYIENITNDINALLRTSETPIKWNKLYHCSACWAAVGDWFILRSYSTIVAAYNVETYELFDFLRLVYGYTAISAQHIAKFSNFCRRKTGYAGNSYRWYPI